MEYGKEGVALGVCELSLKLIFLSLGCNSFRWNLLTCLIKIAVYQWRYLMYSVLNNELSLYFYILRFDTLCISLCREIITSIVRYAVVRPYGQWPNGLIFEEENWRRKLTKENCWIERVNDLIAFNSVFFISWSAGCLQALLGGNIPSRNVELVSSSYICFVENIAFL